MTRSRRDYGQPTRYQPHHTKDDQSFYEVVMSFVVLFFITAGLIIVVLVVLPVYNFIRDLITALICN